MCSRRSSIQRTGRPSRRQILGIDVALAAETSAYIQRDAADARFRQA